MRSRNALRSRLGSALDFRVPEGGMALWVRVDDAIDVDAWVEEGERVGVRFASARPYDFQQRERQFLRLGFSYHDEAELTEATRRMSQALAATRARVRDDDAPAPHRVRVRARHDVKPAAGAR